MLWNLAVSLKCFQTISHMSWKNEDWATVTIAWNLELLSVWGCHSCKSCQEMPLFTTYISLPDRQTNNEWCYDVMMLLDTWYRIPSWYINMLTVPETNSKNPWTSMGLILWHAPFEGPSLFSGKWSPTCHWAHAQHLHHRPEGTLAQIMTLGETSNFGILILYTIARIGSLAPKFGFTHLGGWEFLWPKDAKSLTYQSKYVWSVPSLWIYCSHLHVIFLGQSMTITSKKVYHKGS